ncbi:MAG: hypothetical protein D6705_06505 [Deltaproteobacteria bacterium]|nr:MAG: hypothetical protein D6705_06505 [Deltaproteobacteria bacterium]
MNRWHDVAHRTRPASLARVAYNMGYDRRAVLVSVRSALVSSLLIVATALGPSPVLARTSAVGAEPAATEDAEPSSEAAQAPADGDTEDSGSIDEAKRLYEEGKAHYEMLDYQAAIDKWTQAYALVPETERGQAIRNALVYNIAQAQEKAYELDGDVTRLKQAKGLLERYLEGYVAMYGEEGEAAAEVEKVRRRIAELEARIADNDAGRGPSASDRRRAARQAERKRRAMAVELLQKDAKLKRRYKKSKSFVIAGSVLLGVGGLATLTGIGIAQGDIGRGRAGGWGLAAGGFGMFVAGVVLLPIGAIRMKKVRREALERVTVTAAPVAGRTFAGLAVSGRF